MADVVPNPPTPPNPAPNPPPNPSPNPASAWFEGKADQEMIGHWENKGIKKEDQTAVAIEMTKAAMSLQKHFGVPADQLIKLPKDATDEAGWKGVYTRLGVPAEAKEYDLSGVKYADGSDLETGFVDTMRNALLAGKVPKDAAPGVVKSVVKFLGDADAAEAAERATTLKVEREKLQKDWGPNYEFNRLTAMQGAKRLGISQESVTLLESQAGYANLMESMRKLGAGTTEDTFIDANLGGGSPSTRAGAIARKAELEADPEFRARYLKGDPKAKQEMNNLLLLIHGEAA